MIKDLRFFPTERNNKIFRVLVRMLINRQLANDTDFESIIDILNSSFDQLTQSVSYDGDSLKFKIKFVTDKISTINKISGLLSFIESNQDILTFILVDEIYLKPFKEIIEYPNTEIFRIKELLRDPINHIFYPSFRPLNQIEKQTYLEEYDVKLKDIPRIEKIDFIVRYYNLKCGDIIEITRPSIASGQAISYRVVVNCSWDKLF
jgi:DNA-directed RNA polymerase subunit H (RpoH/RPB5)